MYIYKYIYIYTYTYIYIYILCGINNNYVLQLIYISSILYILYIDDKHFS